MVFSLKKFAESFIALLKNAVFNVNRSLLYGLRLLMPRVQPVDLPAGSRCRVSGQYQAGFRQ